MDKSIALARRGRRMVWPALDLLLLAVVVVVAVSLLHGSSAPPPGLVQNLSGAHAPPVKQASATACFKASPAVSAVRSAGPDVLVRFSGQRGFMRLTFFANADAAIRVSYAHGSPNSFYDNTIWSQVPSRLTNGDYHALSACLPMPKATG
ncbi:MAG TPA: hypothetical protein VHM72_08425 [Solirubrobacteraceae bacterium]|nr:hypothetical protein [Solirubrobacteraceae bacterium]